MPKPKSLFLVAGEPSGDARGAELVLSLKSLDPTIEFSGLGGSRMEQAGVKIVYNLPQLAALGFGDVLKQYFRIRSLFYRTLRVIRELRPSAVVLIDFPGFNIRLAKKINRRVPVFYFVSPQIWAWGKRRLSTIRKHVHHMIVLFRFEKEIYDEAHVTATWVGHPLVDACSPSQPSAQLKKGFSLRDGERAIALLPGSRQTEVRRILPVVMETAELIAKRSEGRCHFLISESDNIPPSVFDGILSAYTGKISFQRIPGRIQDMLAVADAAIVASGTATLETALAGVPFVIVYKTAWSTYLLGKRLVRIPYIGLANVIAGRKIVEEFIQNEARPEKIARDILRLLNDHGSRQKLVKDLKELREKLGPPGASHRAAQTILRLLS